MTGEQASRHRRSVVRETKWGDVKVIEKVVCLGEVTVIPQHISTAIKMISEDSVTDTCFDSQLHRFAVNVQEEALGIAYSIQLGNRPRQSQLAARFSQTSC